MLNKKENIIIPCRSVLLNSSGNDMLYTFAATEYEESLVNQNEKELVWKLNTTKRKMFQFSLNLMCVLHTADVMFAIFR
jgi:hypothetical protein